MVTGDRYGSNVIKFWYEEEKVEYLEAGKKLIHRSIERRRRRPTG